MFRRILSLVLSLVILSIIAEKSIASVNGAALQDQYGNAITASNPLPIKLIGGGASQWVDNAVGIGYTAGNVGIGMSAPSHALEVNGDVKADAFISSGSSSYIEFVNGQKILGDTNGALSTTSYLGLGTTSPSTNLHVVGNARITGLVSCNTIDTDSNGVLSCGTDEGGAGGYIDGTMTSGYVPKAQDSNTVTDSLLFSGASNVGIGTSTPSVQFEITGDLKIGGDDLFMNTNTSGAILVADATNFNPVVMSGDASISSAGAVTVADDSHAHGSGTITEADPQVGAVTNANVCQGDGDSVECNLTQDASGDCAANAVCTGGHSHSDKLGTTLSSANILVGNGSNVATAVSMSGDATITSAGVVAIGTSVIVSADIATGTIVAEDTAFLHSTTATAGRMLIADGSKFASVAISGDVSVDSAGLTSVIQVQQGASPTISGAGDIGIDTTDDQLKYYGGAVRTIPYTYTVCGVIENLAAGDDNYAFWMANDAVTVTGVGCNCRGTCSTMATFTLEDRGGNAMTITDTNPTCATTGAATFKAVTSGNQLTAGEMVAFDVTNSPTADDEYGLCITYTVDAQ